MNLEELRRIQELLKEEDHPLAKSLLEEIEKIEEVWQDEIYESWGEDN